MATSANVPNAQEQDGTWRITGNLIVEGTLQLSSGGIMNKVTGSIQKVDGTQSSAITDFVITAGTPGASVSDVGGSFNQTTLNNIMATLQTRCNSLAAVLRAHGFIP